MVTREFPPLSGGIGYYVYNLAKTLLKRGHDIKVVTRGTTNRTIRRNVDGIDVFCATFFPLRTRAAMRRSSILPLVHDPMND